MKNLLWLCALVALSACTVHPPKRVTIMPDGSVTVETKSPKGRAHYDEDGHFCPPGQAKKGNCQH